MGCFIFLGLVLFVFAIPLGLLLLLFLPRLVRTQRLRAAATALGWTFIARVHYTSIPSADSFQLFSRAHGRRVSNLISGMRGNAQVMMFDYSADLSWFTNRPIVETITLVLSNQVTFPAFALREQRFNQILGLPLLHPVAFPDHPIFSSTYGLDCENEAAARRMFDNDMLRFVESNVGLTIEGSGGQLFIYRRGVMIRTEGLVHAVDEALFLFNSLAASASLASPPPLPPPLSMPIPPPPPSSTDPRP